MPSPHEKISGTIIKVISLIQTRMAGICGSCTLHLMEWKDDIANFNSPCMESGQSNSGIEYDEFLAEVTTKYNNQTNGCLLSVSSFHHSIVFVYHVR